MSKPLKPQENHFADWIIGSLVNTMYVADSLRDTAFDEGKNAVLFRFYPTVPSDLGALKDILVNRLREIANDRDDGMYRIRVDAQQIPINRTQNLLVRVTNAGEKPLVDPV